MSQGSQRSGSGVRSGGGFPGGHQQHTPQPTFSSRHAGSNLATHNRGAGSNATGSNVARRPQGLSNTGTYNRHLAGSGSGGSSNNFASRHAGHVGQSGGQRAGAQQAHHVGGSGQSGNFAARHGGQQGLARVADRNGGAGAHLSRSIANGAVGSNQLNGGRGYANGGRGHSVNAHQMWNNVGRGVGSGLSSFHNYHRVGNGGGVNGNNFARNGYRHGYYGNNFRYNRVWLGFGSGFWPYYAWNYRPFWGGWGGGYGWGSGWRWGWNRPWRFGFGFGYPGFGLGYGGYGLGGFGYGGYGYGGGYGGYGYNSCCMYTPGNSIYSNGYSYAPSAYYGNTPVSTAYSVDSTPPTEAPVQIAQVDPDVPTTVRAQSTDDLDFGAAGEAEFKAGNYDKAVKSWRHAVLDDPKNGVLVMMLSQGLFASGKFDEAAGATQQGMLLLKEADWGVVVTNYRELYAKIGDYTTQLRVLEKARKDKPEDPALRFLLGFHYAYLGFPTEATRELDKAITLAPQDELASRLKDVLEAKQKKAGKPTTVPPPSPMKGD